MTITTKLIHVYYCYYNHYASSATTTVTITTETVKEIEIERYGSQREGETDLRGGGRAEFNR